MAHVRQQIRDAVVAALSGNTSAAARVFASWTYRRQENQLSQILVRTPVEASELDSDDRDLQRDLSVVLHLSAMGETADDTLDTLAAEVEALLGDTLLGGLVWLNNGLTNSSAETDPAGEEPVAVLTLTYSFTYRTTSTDAEAVV